MERLKRKADALRWAVKTWGRTAFAERHVCRLYSDGRGCTGLMAHGRDCPGGRVYYQVGYVALGMFRSIMGSGRSWTEAAEDAARRDLGRS